MIPTQSMVTIALAACSWSLASPAWGQVGATSRVSVDSSAVEGKFESRTPSISRDGRYAAFWSHASNLVAGDANMSADIFVHDRQMAQTTLVSVSTGGTQGDGDSVNPSISGDGRFVAFQSKSTNLVPGGGQGHDSVFVRDRVLGQTTRVSANASGGDADAGSGQAAISADGDWIAFSSLAQDIVPGFGSSSSWGAPYWQVYLHDRVGGRTLPVSSYPDGSAGGANCMRPSVSKDGSFVAFDSGADLAGGSMPFNLHVFVQDRHTGLNALVSVDSSGVPGNLASSSASISDDGSLIAFYSSSDNLVPGASKGVFVHDRATGETTLASTNSAGGIPSGTCFEPSMSADGRFIAFSSSSSGLVAGDTNLFHDIFVKDRQTGSTTRVSESSLGIQADYFSRGAAISGDGDFVAWESSATNLVAGDGNNVFDVFVHDRSECPPPVTHCVASSTSIAGCQAAIAASGAPSLASPAGFTVQSGNVPGDSVGLCIFGKAGAASTPIGTLGGQLCIQPPLFRSAPAAGGGVSGACDGQLSFSLGDLLLVAPMLEPGEVIDLQIWARDPANADGFLLSDALVFTLCS